MTKEDLVNNDYLLLSKKPRYNKCTNLLLSIVLKQHSLYSILKKNSKTVGINSYISILEDPKSTINDVVNTFVFDLFVNRVTNSKGNKEYQLVIVSDCVNMLSNNFKILAVDIIKIETIGSLSLYYFKVNKKHYPDINLFLKGKYSKFSNSFKYEIANRKIKTTVKNPWLCVLDKDPEFRKKLESKLGMKIEDDQELLARPNLRNEILDVRKLQIHFTLNNT